MKFNRVLIYSNMKFAIFVFLLVLCTGVQVNAENGFDAVFDNVLQKFNDQMKSEKMCQKGLKDVSMSINHKVWIIPIKVHVTASGGSVQDLCTFKRSGDVALSQTDKSTVTLTLGVDMGILEIDYKDLKAKASIFYNHNFGALKVLIQEHSIEGQVTLSLPSTNSCKVSVDYVKVTSLGNIHVYLNGQENSKFDNLAENDINSLKSSVSSVLKSKIQTVLNSENVCKEIIAAGITLN